MGRELIHNDLSKLIIGATTTVPNELRAGLDEKLYERGLAIELRDQACRVQQQQEFPVHYCGRRIGALIPDLIVNDLVIADANEVSEFHVSHTAQMLGYSNITGLKLALPLNFKQAKLDWKRIVN